MSSVLVVGGGIAGMQASLDLATMGHQVHLVEKNKSLGGNLLRLDRIFPTNEKVDAVLEDYAKRIKANPNVSVFRESRLLQVEGKFPSFRITIEGSEGKKNLTVGAIILATGFSPYDVAKKKEYGYGRSKGVISAIDFESALMEENAEKKPNSKGPESAVFVQCVGFRDARANEYCSAFCCKDALKNAILFKKEHADVQVVVTYIDIRTPSLYERMYSEARELGVKFIRSRPAEVYERNGKVAVSLENTLTGHSGTLESDLVVLSVGAVPCEETPKLAKMMNLPVSETGFFKTVSLPSGTGVPGIFLAGCCCGPKDIDHSVAEASAAAAQVNLELGRAHVED